MVTCLLIVFSSFLKSKKRRPFIEVPEDPFNETLASLQQKLAEYVKMREHAASEASKDDSRDEDHQLLDKANPQVKDLEQRIDDNRKVCLWFNFVNTRVFF